MNVRRRDNGIPEVWRWGEQRRRERARHMEAADWAAENHRIAWFGSERLTGVKFKRFAVFPGGSRS